MRKYLICELESEKEMLIASLGRGNMEKVTLQSGEPALLEVDPENKKIQFYYMDFKELSVPPLENYGMNCSSSPKPNNEFSN